MNCVFLVSETGQYGFNTGRSRFRVFCTTCSMLVHPATTGPEQMSEAHKRDVTAGIAQPYPERKP